MCQAAAHNHSLPSPEQETPASPQPLAADTGKRTRRKLWDLPHKLHCPVIGTCLEVDELRRLARKTGNQASGPMSDYDVHLNFVWTADSKSSLSIAAQKALEKKYAAQIRRFSRLKTAAELEVQWDEALARGEVPGALWALLTHPRCTVDLEARGFEDVHMLSHQIGAGQRADLKRLTEAEAELARMQRDFDALVERSRQQLEDRERRILRLERDLRVAQENQRRLSQSERESHQALEDLRRQSARSRMAELETGLEVTGRRLAQREQERDHWRKACETAEQRASRLESLCQDKMAECDSLERLIAQSLMGCDNCERETCNLRGRRILCVGGHQGLVEQYRALVARCNGQFEHHDGGLEDSRQRLESMLSSADAVVCATEFVSHDAYYRLKRFCKRHEKPHYFLRSSGISNFAKALDSMAG